MVGSHGSEDKYLIAYPDPTPDPNPSQTLTLIITQVVGSHGSEDKYLIATSEQPICGYHMNEWMDEGALPLRYAGAPLSDPYNPIHQVHPDQNYN